VKKPNIIKRRENHTVPIITAEDDQEFLQKHKVTLEKDDSEKKKDEGQSKGFLGLIKGGLVITDQKSTPNFEEDDDLVKKLQAKKSESSSTAPTAAASAPAAGAAPGEQNEKTMLKTFFTSLINNPSKLSKQPSFSGGATHTQTRSDAAKSLDKLKMATSKK
jgi:hypothetical protein